jgi:ABC-type bacteriocin/lantibiotic exporter with double-glycine peptidase domain
VLIKPCRILRSYLIRAVLPFTKVMSNILKSRAGRGVIWVLSHAEHARQFERVLVLKAGRVVAQGAASELDKPGSILHQQAAAQ